MGNGSSVEGRKAPHFGDCADTAEGGLVWSATSKARPPVRPTRRLSFVTPRRAAAIVGNAPRLALEPLTRKRAPLMRAGRASSPSITYSAAMAS